MRRGWRFAGLGLAAAICLAGCQRAGQEQQGQDRPAAQDSKRLVESAKEPQNWLSYNGGYDEQRFSTLTGITRDNVSQLRLAWYHDLDTSRGEEASPLIVDGTLYTTTAWDKLIALDAVTGAQKWIYDPKVPGKSALHACCDVVNRGAAYDDGTLFLGTIDGRLIAVDAQTGAPRWSTQTFDPAKPYSITGAPRVARGLVLIGNGGAEYGVRGYLSAYDEKTGKLVWRFYVTPGKPGEVDHAPSDEVLERLARKTWFGENYWKTGGGGTVWDSIVYDPQYHRIYFGTGNGSPWNRAIRSEGKGDNLFLSSVIAVDADTGKYLWHYQETPGEEWDFTATQQIVLGTLPIDGKSRDVIMHAPKNGFFYVLDRATGKLLSADKFVPVNWAEKVDLATGRPVEHPNARYKNGPFLANSGGFGAHNWQPMAYSPQTRLMYIPAQQVPALYKADAHFSYRPGLMNFGADIAAKLPEKPAEIAAMLASMQGRLIAWDPVAKKEAWRAPHAGTWNGGLLATAGGLVFQGLSDATMRAYDAANGKELWRFDAQTPLMAAPVTYSVGGVQYVTIVAGYGGAFGLAAPAYERHTYPVGRVLTFRIGGTATLPPLAKAGAAPFLPSKESWPAETVAQGDHLFTTTCAVCHGAEARSAGVLPDLRRSGALASRDAWKSIVIDGALQDQGMVSFAKYLSPDQAEAIRAYVNSRARVDTP